MMKFTPLRVILMLALLFLAVSFLGGSAVWSMLGFSDDLTIEGDAQIVRTELGDIGGGWSVYGGDQGGNRYSAAIQINTDNVDQLSIAWIHRSGALDGKSDEDRSKSALQTTPNIGRRLAGFLHAV